MAPKVSLIVAALSPGLAIGAKGKLPWRLKQEIKYFRDVTSKCKDGHINAVVMGRKTWESIPARFRPLPNRLNVVLSRNCAETARDGVLYGNSLDGVLQRLQSDDFSVDSRRIDKIFIIGGAQIYNAFVNDPRVDNLLITDVKYVGDEAARPEFDTFLNWELGSWRRSGQDALQQFVEVEHAVGVITEGDYEYEYTMWERL